jgi:predicted transposase/invertase (TIGR01784 family)
LRLDDTEKQVFQAAISTMGLDEQEEIMEIVTSWQQEGAQKALEKVALNLLQRGMIVQEIAQITGLSVEQVQQLQAKVSPEN